MKILRIVVGICLILAVAWAVLLRARRGTESMAALRKFRYAHRGLYDKEAGIPENSLPAFSRAIARGFGAELDVHLLRDGTLAVFHDSDVKRMTGREGYLEDLSADELKDYALDGTKETIPQFKDVLALFAGTGLPLIVEVKSFRDNFAELTERTKVVNMIIASVRDALSPTIKAGYMLTEGRKIEKIPEDAPVIMWRDFMKLSHSCYYKTYKVKREGADPAVILYSGGTTGTTKGIVLTNKNFNALGQQVIAANPMFRPGDRMLAAMPLFHGFGLGVCVHTMLSQGGRCILIPRFTAKSYAKQIVKYKCNFIAGVPTLYEALLRLPSMDGANLSSLKGVFSGGDSLSIELKKKFDKFLYDHKASIQVREGYGTTETVTACCLTPPHMFKEGSIGLPFPDTYIKIVELDTDREVPYGQEGEILLAGPTVMKEYMNNPEETAQTLRTHADGLTWVYTGDLGVMDEQGFIYFRGRAKRMIISSGYNVYPGQIENILDAHEYVQMSCVIGVPDPYKMQKVKAFVKLAQGVPATEETKQVLMAYCRKNVAKYAMPYDIEFKEDMPKTLVGKVAYRQLEEEELAKIKAAEEK